MKKKKPISRDLDAEENLLQSDEMKRMESMTQDLLKVSKEELERRIALDRQKKNRPVN